MKIGDEVYVHGYIDEIRQDTVIIRNDGGYFGTVPSEVVDQESCEDKRTGTHACDCISRQAAIDVLDTGLWGVEWDKALATVMLKNLPSAEKKSGKWQDMATELSASFERHEFVCTECACAANYFVGGSEEWWDTRKPNYCPNCGARMERDGE